MSTAIGMFPSPGRLRVQNYTLRQLIQDTYGLKKYQVLGGPSWMDSDRYDIEAKADAGANLGQMTPMVRALLTDRFGLRLHKETRSLPVYELTAAKSGPKLRDLGTSDSSAPWFRIRQNEFSAHKIPMSQFADALAGQLGRPVVDATKLSGEYDFSLRYTTPRKGPVSVIVIDQAEKPSSN
jgi:uncharacterized protein (TIGR03435 family)